MLTKNELETLLKALERTNADIDTSIALLDEAAGPITYELNQLNDESAEYRRLQRKLLNLKRSMA